MFNSVVPYAFVYPSYSLLHSQAEYTSIPLLAELEWPDACTKQPSSRKSYWWKIEEGIDLVGAAYCVNIALVN